MPQIKIIKSADQQSVRFELVGLPPAIIPCDGGFHKIDGRLLGVVDASDIEVSIEHESKDTRAPDPAAASVEGAEELGGSSAPSSPTEGSALAAFAKFDRDGDGRPGGSRPGNKTAPAAKGKRKK